MGEIFVTNQRRLPHILPTPPAAVAFFSAKQPVTTSWVERSPLQIGCLCPKSDQPCNGGGLRDLATGGTPRSRGGVQAYAGSRIPDLGRGCLSYSPLVVQRRSQGLPLHDRPPSGCSTWNFGIRKRHTRGAGGFIGVSQSDDRQQSDVLAEQEHGTTFFDVDF